MDFESQDRRCETEIAAFANCWLAVFVLVSFVSCLLLLWFDSVCGTISPGQYYTTLLRVHIVFSCLCHMMALKSMMYLYFFYITQ